MLLGLALILLFEALGELASSTFALPLPGPVLGMAGLTLTLAFGKRHPIGLERASRSLLVYMPLFFIPAGVGVIELERTLQRNFLPVAASLVGSTLVALCVTGWTMKALSKEPAE